MDDTDDIYDALYKSLDTLEGSIDGLDRLMHSRVAEFGPPITEGDKVAIN
jgi:hypothetical protein